MEIRAKRKYAFFIIMAVLAVFISLTRMPADQIGDGDIRSPKAGFLPPHFSSELMNGGNFDETSVSGQVVIINFWASWCPPCKAEMPALQAASLEYADQNVVIIGVNATSQDSLSDAKAFIADEGISFPILLDPSGKLNADFNINSLPTTYFIASDGKIKNVIVGGPISETSLRAQIENLLGGN